jgi:hypothetical protein
MGGHTMQTITIAERLWLEPTILGATLNYSEQPEGGYHYRVGMGFRSIAGCDKALAQPGSIWMLQDKSLIIQVNLDGDISMIFCPGTEMERQVIMTGEILSTFKNAIHFLNLASEPQQN